MCPSRSCYSRLLLSAFLVALAFGVGHARAQVDADADAAVANVGDEQRLAEIRNQFDRWIAVHLNADGFQSRDLLEVLLLRRLNHLRTERHLTDAQLTKLKLAGHIDIKRFIDRLDQSARDLARAPNNQDEVRTIIRSRQSAVNEILSGFFIEGSLFYKTLARMLRQQLASEPADVLIPVKPAGGDRSTSGPDSVETENDHARIDFMHLTSSIAFWRDFERLVRDPLEPDGGRGIHFKRLLAEQLDELTGDCDLTERQLKTLRRAGEEDVRALLLRLEQFEKRYQELLAFVNNFPVSEAEALKCSYWMVFGASSHFAAAVAATLSRDQIAAHEQRLAGRNLVRYQNATHAAAESLAKAVRMNAQQVAKLDELLRAETWPPRRFGRFSQPEPGTSGNSDTYLVLYQAARIPEARWKAAFSENLCEKLDRRLAWRRNAYVEEHLKRHGYILDERPVAARSSSGASEAKSGNK